MDPEAMAQYRYRAVCEVLGGSPIGEVAERYGTTRQSLHTWRKRFEQEGLLGLSDRSRRPRTSPTRLPAAIEAAICDVRRQHPRWGARRISHELAQRQDAPVPSRATVHRVLVRNGLIAAQLQEHKRKYRRWQREAPMHLWQMDLVGGVMLADGRECKMVTGIDDHSRFVVISTVVAVPTGRAVCETFAAAMRRYGVPSEVLTDNGKQFTGRHTKPEPVEVLFERVCRENGITARRTKPRSPTTTGKIERFHRTLREEFLDRVAPFASQEAAQQAVDEWVAAYNYQRPHQSLDMAVPASRFRPNGPTRTDPVPVAEGGLGEEGPEPFVIGVIETPPPPPAGSGAVEFEARVPPSGELTLVPGALRISLPQAMAGRPLTIWADQRSVHVVMDGHLIKTVASRLTPENLRWLTMRGARPAGPPPGAPALPRSNGKTGRLVVPAGEAVEIDRLVHRDGLISVKGEDYHVSNGFAGRKITLRLDGHLMHAITDDALIGTWPCPVGRDQLPSLRGARAASGRLPAPALPTGAMRVQRRVSDSGRIMVTRQRLKLGKRNAGKLVTVIIEDTYFRILHEGEEIAVKQRRDTGPVTMLRVVSKREDSQKQSSIS